MSFISKNEENISVASSRKKVAWNVEGWKEVFVFDVFVVDLFACIYT